MAGKIAAQTQTNKAMQSKKDSNTLLPMITRMAPAIKAALPSVITPERFTRMTTTALNSNPKLQQCTPVSFLGAMMTAAQLGVEPNTPLGQAYLLPYFNRKENRMECQFQLGYKGLIDLAYRSGEVNLIQAHVVYENDDFTYELGLDPILKHIPARENRGKPVGVYAIFRTKSGASGFDFMSTDDINAHSRKYSKAYGSGPWQTNWEEMAKKTVLKRVLKYAPLKSEFARAQTADETTRQTIDSTDYSEEILPVTDYEVQDDAPAADPSTGEVIEPAAEPQTTEEGQVMMQ